MTTLWRRVIACGLAVLALVLAGCTDDGVRPSDTLPPTSSPTPTATTEDLPGPPGYPLPPEAQAYTTEGATAFVYYFFDLLSATLSTLDSAPLRELSRDCQTCDQVADGYDADRAAGVVTTGGAYTVSGLGPPGLRKENGLDIAGFSILIDNDASQRLDGSGQIIGTYPAAQSRGGITIGFLPDTKEWQVLSLSFIPN